MSSGLPGGGEADLDPREREMLAYLEDLQANNPAEYDMLVQQLQEQQQQQAGAGGKGRGGASACDCVCFVF